MRWFLLLLNLSGCATQTQLPVDLPKSAFDTRPNAAPVQLDATVPSAIQQATSEPNQAPESTFILEAKKDEQNDPIQANLYVTVPFTIAPNQVRFAPKDIEVRIGQTVVPFTKTARKKPNAPMGWRFANGRLVLRAPNVQPGTKVTVHHKGLAQTHEQLSSFGGFTFRKRDDTYQGLNVPQDTTVQWDVHLPPSAQFRTQIAAQAVAIQSKRSQSVTATLNVHTENVVTTVGTKRVTGDALPVDWHVDLSAWSEQRVTLSLSISGHTSGTLEAAFLGAPTVYESIPSRAPRRVVVIGLDTTRPDHFSFAGYTRKTTPEIDARLPHFTRFTHAWTPAPRTRPSFRSATTGMLPLNAVGATNISEYFRDAGFSTAGFVANIHLNPRFDFDHGFDEWHLDTRAKADTQVDRSLEWLRRNQARDTYLFLHIMDPHLLYVAPKPFERRFEVGPPADLPKTFTREWVIRRMKQGSIKDAEQQEIRRRYDAELAYTSHQVDRFLSALDAMAGNTLVVIHSDHGEEFWEHHGFEHNHTLYDEVTKALLLVRPPDGAPHVTATASPATLSDIGPTLLDYTGLPHHEFDGHSLRPDIQGETTTPRPIPIGHLMYDKEAWGVVLNNHKYIIETVSGTQMLFNLGNDPGEQDNLAAKTDLTPFVRALSVSHQMPAGPGWRIQVPKNAKPFTVDLPAPAIATGILDPEAGRSRRANLAWGERAKFTRTDVGRVELSPNKTTLTITPSGRASGVAYVLFRDPHASPQSSDDIQAGTVLIPPLHEAARMNGNESGTVRADDMELLKALGYVSP